MKGDETIHRESISLKIYYKDLRKLELVDSEEQTKLAVKAKEGDERAMKKLIESNLRFVLSVAKEYTYTGIPLEDLIQEGNIGIMKAVDKFDETKGYHFISYAVWWIRQTILQTAYETGKSVRLPVNRINIINKVNKAIERLSKELNREPSVREISESIEVSEKDVRSALVDSGMDVSLNSSVSDESATELQDYLEGDGLNEIEGGMNKSSLKTEIDSVLSGLTDRESQILKMYFGIGEHEQQEPMTLAEIGEKIGLTNERVRQIKEFSLRKLRTFNNSAKLKEFLTCEIR
jgi:RNA polymerase primary sigma factor